MINSTLSSVLCLASTLVAGTLLVTSGVAEAAPVTAKSADAFVDSIGVNTHFGYVDTVYGNRTGIQPKLSALGVRHIREGIVDYDDIAAFLNGLKTSDNIQIKLLQGLNKRVEPNPWSSVGALDFNYIDQAYSVIQNRYSANNEGIEGPNEVDANYGSDTNWVANLKSYTSTMRSKRATYGLSGKPIIQPAMAHYYNTSQVGDMSASIDYGNMHSYPGGGPPSDGLSLNLSSVSVISGTKPVMATETGYHNAVNQATCDCNNPIPEDIGAKYSPRMVAEYYRAGVARTYFYEFVDEGTNLGEQENMFGLLRNDLTQKPAYNALQAMINLLKEPGANFTPASLDYSISGTTDGVRDLLLQKSDGKFYLLLWVEKSGWNKISKTYTAVPNQAITVGFAPSISSINLYKPTSNGTTLVSTTNNTQTYNLSLGDEVTILQITPANMVPVGEVDTTDGQNGVITARGENLPDEGKTKAFDNYIYSKWLDFGTSSPYASWIQYMYPGTETHAINKYTLTSAQSQPMSDPYSWKLYGITAGGTQVQLDSRIGQTFTLRGEKKSYSIANGTAYRGYRLQVDNVANPSTAAWMHVAEIEFIEPSWIVDGAIYEISSASDNTAALDVSGGLSANSTPVQGYQRNSTVSQFWKFVRQTDASYEVIPQVTGGAGQRLDVSGGGGSGSALQLYGDNDTGAQRWKFEKQADGTFEIIPQHINSLRLQFNGKGNQASVVTDSNAAVQHWNLNKQ